MEAKVKQLESDNSELERTVADLTAKLESVKEKEQKKRESDEKRHAEEVEKLKQVNAQLKSNLESMLSAPQRK